MPSDFAVARYIQIVMPKKTMRMRRDASVSYLSEKDGEEESFDKLETSDASWSC